MKLDRLVRLEKTLEGKLDRLTRRKGTPEEPSEWSGWDAEHRR